MSETRLPKTIDGHRVRAALRAADGDLVVAARALRMSTREVLHVLLCAPSSPEASAFPSGTRRRYELEVDAVGAPAETSPESDDDPDRPAWTDDDDSWGGAGETG